MSSRRNFLKKEKINFSNNSFTIKAIFYQVPIDVIVQWLTDKDRPLHKANKAPEGLGFVFHFAEYRRQEIAHSLSVTGRKKVMCLFIKLFTTPSLSNSR